MLNLQLDHLNGVHCWGGNNVFREKSDNIVPSCRYYSHCVIKTIKMKGAFIEKTDILFSFPFANLGDRRRAHDVTRNIVVLRTKTFCLVQITLEKPHTKTIHLNSTFPQCLISFIHYTFFSFLPRRDIFSYVVSAIHRKKKDGGCTFYHNTLRPN